MVIKANEEGSGKVIQPDLASKTQLTTDQLYFDVPVTGLLLDTPYAFQFQWIYEDETRSGWSPGFKLTTAKIPTLTAPKFLNTDLSYFNGQLVISWNGQDANGNAYTKAFDRINVYIKDETLIGSPYRLVGFLKSAGTLRVAVPPRAHSVKLTVVSVDGAESFFSAAQFETPKLIPNTLPTDLSAEWVGSNFKLNWTHNPAEEFFSYYRITLTSTSGNTSKVVEIVPTSGVSAQSYVLSLSQNKAMFGLVQRNISATIKTVNIYGNEGSPVSFPLSAYVSSLPAATITASPISNGYSVSYTIPTNANFSKIEIQEVESSASTAPTTGFADIFSGSTNPAVVIVPNTNKRWVRARFMDDTEAFGAYGAAVQVEPTSPVVVDNAGPDNVASVTASSGIDTSGYLGFNAYADISWPAVTGGGIRGYRIRFSNDNNTTFSYVDSPGSGTTYRLSGLAIGATYKIAVATYDEYNNTSTSYVAGPDVLVTGTPAVTNYITGGPFQFGVGVGAPITTTQFAVTNNGSGSYSVNGTQSATLTLSRGVTYTFNINAPGHPFYIQTSGNGYNALNVFSSGVSLTSGTRDSGVITFQVPQNAPDTLYYQCQFHESMYGQINIVNSNTGNKGLYFDNSNYWYLNASDSARLKVGGSNSNYLYWDGATFAIDGNITARQGTFSGNVSIASGGSLYSGTITSQGALSGAGYILNNLGLTFNSATTNGITTINASNGLFTTSSANIGGWNVNSSSVSKTSNQGTITLDSSNAQIRASSASYTAGIAAPDLNNEADIVIWAGGPRSTASNFYVTASGTVVMKSAIITGYASADSVNGLAKTDMSNVTTIDGGKITTGIIRNSTQAGPSDGSDYSTSGMAINLNNGTITAKNFRISSDGTAIFRGSVFSELSLSAPSITGASIGGSKIVVSSAISASALVAFSDSGLSESTDSSSGGSSAGSSPSTTQTAVTIESGKIIARTSETINNQTLSGQSGVLRLEGENYVELLAGGTQSAMFDTTKSSLTFTTGLYLGNPNTSSSSSVQDHSAPWVTVDAKMRLRRGAPLFYPGGTAGAYVRNIYIKNTTSNPSSTTGNVGDIMITY
jgi:hypothetical protein